MTLKLRYIVTTKLRICDLSGERPLDWAALSVSALLPSLDVALKGLARVKARIQALARQHCDFDLGHVQPTGVLGRVSGIAPGAAAWLRGAHP